MPVVEILKVAVIEVELVNVTALGVIIAPVEAFIALTIGTAAKSVPVIVTAVEVDVGTVEGLIEETAGAVPPPPDSAAK